MICVLKNVKDTLSFDPGVYIDKNTINTIEPMKIIIKLKMNALMIIAMLLTTASARTLKEYSSCTEDYQPPNYWGQCIDGMYKPDEVWQGGYDIYCNCLVILVPEDIVGNKTLTIRYTDNHGSIMKGLFNNLYGYYALILQQSLYGPDFDIEFYLDHIMVHSGNYQQNSCFFEAGSITTNDTNAKTYEGSFLYNIAGHVIVTF